MSDMARRGHKRYVEGGPCAAGCGGVFRYADNTRRGLCKECFLEERRRPNTGETRPCACGCLKDVPQWPHKRRFLSKQCSERLRSRLRLKRKMENLGDKLAARLAHYPALKFIIEERAEVNARGLSHLCMYCEASPPVLMGGDTCADEECKTRWNSDYSRGRREVARTERPPKPPTELVCPCPCQRRFTPTSAYAWNRAYFSQECWRVMFNERRRKRRARATRRLRKPHPWQSAKGEGSQAA